MKIQWQINFLTGVGADRWIVTGYRDAFVDLGHEFHFLPNHENLPEHVERVQPDILAIALDKLTYENLPAIKRARARGTKVFLWVSSLFKDYPEGMKIIAEEDPIDVYRGETEEDWMKEFVEATGKKYVVTPNAANHRLHKPGVVVRKYECDIAYLGANLPLKRPAFEKFLFPLRGKYQVKIYGPGWTIKDNAMRGLAKISRKIGWMSLNDYLSKKRISVPAEEENQLYSSAKISLNFHERADFAKNHVILNERTFKIPACGGFEVCDFVPPLRNYFTEEEMVMARDEDWLSTIDYYMTHESERKRIQEKGIARALRDHTYINRAKQLIDLYHQAHSRT